MSTRKAHNYQARMARSVRGILAQHHVAVIHLEPSGKQGLINWKYCRSIPPGQRIANAVCDYAHSWTIYFSVFCIDPLGRRYTKSIEVVPQGQYKAEDLEQVIIQSDRALRDECNAHHIIGTGWLARTSGESLDEEQAAKLFEVAGAWVQGEMSHG